MGREGSIDRVHAQNRYIGARFGGLFKTNRRKQTVHPKNKERLHQKYVDSKEKYLWAISSYDILKYKEIRKLSIINYYIYVENLEAEQQRQEKRKK